MMMNKNKKTLLAVQVIHYIATAFNSGFALFPLFIWLAMSLPGGFAMLFISIIIEGLMVASLYFAPKGHLWKRLLNGTKYFYGGLKLLIGASMFYIGLTHFSDTIKLIVYLTVGITSLIIFYQVIFKLNKQLVPAN
jgi:hypothetical protein